jgi:uncharacterized membrane protein YfcA
MSPLEAVLIALAGVAAGTINTVVGSGTLITFPTLLAFGVPPVTANVSNTVGLVPGSMSGVFGYRRELAGQGARVLRLGSASLLGGVVGALLLLWLPSSAFDTIVPVLIAPGVVLVVLGPHIQRSVAARAESRGGIPDHGVWWVWPAVAAAGVYGGYFGAAQGVLLMAILGIGVVDSIQRHTATKNLLALIVNAVAALVFIAVADVDWAVAGLIALGSVVGGQIGAGVGRRLPPALLRAVIAAVGIVARQGRRDSADVEPRLDAAFTRGLALMGNDRVVRQSARRSLGQVRRTASLQMPPGWRRNHAHEDPTTGDVRHADGRAAGDRTDGPGERGWDDAGRW